MSRRKYNFRDRTSSQRYGGNGYKICIDSDPSDDDMDEDFVPVGHNEDDIKITISRNNRRKSQSRDPYQEEKKYEVNQNLPDVPFQPKNFRDLLKLSQHICDTQKMYVSCQKLPEIHSLLLDMDSWIGLETVKDAMAKFMMVQMKKSSAKKSGQMEVNNVNDQYWKHMVVTGPPGVGKTMIAKTIASFYSRLLEAPSEEVVVGSRRNMISDFQGQTKTMVDNLVKEAISKSGILFIDEAPNLNEGDDQYGRVAIKTLMELMDLHADKLVVIFAGYRPEMQANIMGADPGMKRRIQVWFDIEPYTPKELLMIFHKIIQDMNQSLSKKEFIDEEWMKDHYRYFPYYGGSIRNFVEKVMTLHHVSTFGISSPSTITIESLQGGFQLYKDLCLDPEYKSQLESLNQTFQEEEKEDEATVSVEHYSPVIQAMLTGTDTYIPTLQALMFPHLRSLVIPKKE